MLVALARSGIWNRLVDNREVHLPTSTEFNNIYWQPARVCRYQALDNIVHNGEEAHEARRAEETCSALDVIAVSVARVAEGSRFERCLSPQTREFALALLAWQAEPRLAKTLLCENDAEVADWRTVSGRKRMSPELEETWTASIGWCAGITLPKKSGDSALNYMVAQLWRETGAV